jgi:Na+/citrate or Na+/malate symporter
LNPASIRRFVFTLITGYLAIFGVQQLPYEFENQWLVLVPVLIVVYIITVWLDGVFFKSAPVETTIQSSKKAQQKQSPKKGFGA